MSHRPLVSQLRLFPLCYLENPSERQAEKNFRNLGFRAEVCMVITLSRLKLKKLIQRSHLVHQRTTVVSKRIYPTHPREALFHRSFYFTPFPHTKVSPKNKGWDVEIKYSGATGVLGSWDCVTVCLTKGNMPTATISGGKDMHISHRWRLPYSTHGVHHLFADGVHDVIAVSFC